MAKTVIEAFNEFLKDCVNLDKDKSAQAKSSRNWLVEQIEKFENEEKSDFPNVYSARNIFYGSFERKTKTRPLDDVDLMIGIQALGTTYWEEGGKIEMYVPESAERLKKLCYDNSNILNSKKVINLFVKKLAGIPQYKKADIKRNQEAATVELQSYDWNFDIVPCFFTKPEQISNRNYYLIPDGLGNWKKTDPRLDRDRVKEINETHNGNVLNVIRTIKYWNSRPTMPSIGSYLLENMVLDYYASQSKKADKFVDMEIVDIFFDLHTRVYSVVNDPKNIQGNLNNLTYDEKTKISQRAYSDYVKAFDARKFEMAGNQKDSINKWREIFGNDFPKYEE